MEALLLRPEEAAQALGICRARVYELIMSREIPSIQLGKSRRISVDELRRFVEEKVSLAAAK